jgi:hypothetical protein
LTHAPVTRPKGSWQKPLSDNELKEKFIDCAGAMLSERHVVTLFERLMALDELQNLRSLLVFKAA